MKTKHYAQYLLITECRWQREDQRNLGNDSCLCRVLAMCQKLLEDFCVPRVSLSFLTMSKAKYHHQHDQHFMAEELAAGKDQVPALVLWLMKGGDFGLRPRLIVHGGKVERVVCIFHLE